MRRTVLNATALACTAVLAGSVPAFADGASPVPSARQDASGAPSADPSTRGTEAPSAVPGKGQVGVVPKGAPDTGVASGSQDSGGNGMLIGGGAAGAFAAGGAAFLVVRRRRATGA
ncbi:sortase-dependent protein [Streptomyces sp. NPDC051636]|uniref:sortase-dependent protein n=1 Tax=Streptomyces sp. NPDC051636 TaxID=3365663 RepID=UPI003794EB92